MNDQVSLCPETKLAGSSVMQLFSAFDPFVENYRHGTTNHGIAELIRKIKKRRG